MSLGGGRRRLQAEEGGVAVAVEGAVLILRERRSGLERYLQSSPRRRRDEMLPQSAVVQVGSGDAVAQSCSVNSNAVKQRRWQISHPLCRSPQIGCPAQSFRAMAAGRASGRGWSSCAESSCRLCLLFGAGIWPPGRWLVYMDLSFQLFEHPSCQSALLGLAGFSG